ncbi:MAG: PAS domain S-box protein [Gemmatimonadetes bacterium]|nr:PAS domain S-box protein [Gemmatimonadota bacterium]
MTAPRSDANVMLVRLREACESLARMRDRGSLERELARHAALLTDAKGGIVARADGSGADATMLSHWVAGAEPHAVAAGADTLEAPADAMEALNEVVRSGRSQDPAQSGDMAVPIRAGHKMVGVLAVYGGTRTSQHHPLLTTLAAAGAAALAAAEVVADAERDKRQSEALAELAQALGSSRRLGDVFHLGMRHSSAILGAAGAAIVLLRDEYFHIVAASGCATAAQGLYVPADANAVARDLRKGHAVISNTIAPTYGASARALELSNAQKFAAAPMRGPGGVIGALVVVNRDSDFGDTDIRVLDRLASQLAVAVEQVRLLEEAASATRELGAAFDAIAGALVVIDSDAVIVRHSARLAVLTGAPDGVAFVGRSLFDVLLGALELPREDDPIGTAIVRRAVGRGLMRHASRGRVYDIVASPHPAGGAVVTVDDVTSDLALAERYRLVIESTADAVLIAEPDGTISFANPAGATLFGREVANVGLTLPELVSPDWRAQVHALTERGLAGERVHFEARAARPDGDVRVLDASLSPLRGGGASGGFVAAIRDATDEARAREAMHEADRRYRLLVDTATDAIFTVDHAGMIGSVNPACERETGFARAQLIGRRLTSLVEPVEAAAFERELERALAGAGRQFAWRLVRADGPVRSMSVAFSPIVVEGRVTGLLGIARPMPEHQATVAEGDRLQRRFAGLVEAAEDMICTLDEEGHITSANRAMARLVGLPRHRVVGRQFADLVPEDQRAALWEAFTRTLEGGRRRLELRMTTPRGRALVLHVSTAPLIEHDHVNGALAILRDVTEERAVYEQAARREKLAALGELIGGVAHEVNSPLTGILAHGQLLQSEFAEGTDTRMAADTIVNESRRAARIVAKLLTFARQNPTDRIPTEINQVVNDTLELRRYALRMQRITLDVDLTPKLPLVSADPFQLQQVFINLLSNAEQAVLSRDEAGRRIAVSTQATDSAIVVRITDTGTGIAPEHLPHIFNPFYTTKPRGIGTGLGLSISFGIVREHGGTIHAASLAGEGATFTVRLPVHDPPSGIRSN